MNFKSWIYSIDAHQPKNDNDKPTHLLLDGGKIFLPDDKEREFYYRYSMELINGRKVFVVESRPDIFKFMMDLDIQDITEWNKNTIQILTKHIQSIIYYFFETNYSVICCTAPCKTKKEGQGDQKTVYKSGVHLIWPRLYVNSNTALNLRNAILQKIKADGVPGLPNLKPFNSWEDLLDDRIYSKNGYRMVGSDKLPPYRGKDKDQKRIPENRPYWPTFIMNSKGELREEYLKRLLQDVETLILDTAIRFVPDAIKIGRGTVFKKIPKWFEPTKETKNKYSDQDIIFVGSREFANIEFFIRKNIPEYRTETNLIKEIRRTPGDNLLIISNSQYCMNIDRNHNSCGIYFIAKPEGIYQKCHCPCDNLKGRKNGYCHQYTSKCYRFPPEIRKELFPNTKSVYKIMDDDEPQNNSTNSTQTKKDNGKKKKKTITNVYVPRSGTVKVESGKLTQSCNEIFETIMNS